MILKCKVSLKLVGCEREFDVEIDDSELEGLSEDERDALFSERAQETMWDEQLVEVSWEEPA